MQEYDSGKKLEKMMKAPSPKKWVGIVKVKMVKEGHSLYGMKQFTSPDEAVEMVEPLFQMSDREMVLVVSLNIRMEPMAVEIAAVGGIDSCPVDFRTIFKHAIVNQGSFLLCIHNHPSGDSRPSLDDRKMTQRLEQAGKLLGIPLVDHIVVGERGTYFSFKEAGLLSDVTESEEVR